MRLKAFSDRGFPTPHPARHAHDHKINPRESGFELAALICKSLIITMKLRRWGSEEKYHVRIP
jgi:hypothetical protein